jgi:diadenylate cyclase
MFQDFFSTFTSYPPLELIVEMGVIWLCVFLAFRFLRGTRGAGVVKGFAILLALFMVLQLIGLSTDSFGRLQFLVNYFIGLVYILLIVIFQPELRKAAIQIGQARFLRSAREPRQDFVKSVNEAVDFLSKNQFGALVAIERSVRLGGLVEGGQMLDAKLSARLLQSIFWPNSPLHDLGVVVRDDRILAAGVQFPLAEEGTLPAQYGSRHRAAVGLATESDCVVVIVSEETGIISLAVNGRLESPIPREKFKNVLSNALELNVEESDSGSRSSENSDTESDTPKTASDAG